MRKTLLPTMLMLGILVLSSGFHSGKAAYASDEPLFSVSQESVVCELSNAYDIDYASNTLLISETNNKQIKNLTLDSNIDLDYEPTAIANNYHDTIFFSKNGADGLAKIEEEEVTHYNEYSHLSTLKSIRTVYDISCNVNGTVYAIAHNSNNTPIIIYKERPDDKFKLYQELDGLNLSSDTKICASLDSDFVIFYNGEKIYKALPITANDTLSPYDEINSNSFLPEVVYSIPNETLGIVDMKLDFYHTLFILKQQGEEFTFYRCEKNSDKYTEITTSAFQNALSFALDYTDGYIYSLTQTSLSKFKIMDQQENHFINVIKTDNYPKYNETQLEVTLIQTKENNIPLYEYDNPLYIKKLNGEQQILFSANTTLIALSHSSVYFFVLLNNIAEENVFGYVKKSSVNELAPPTLTVEARISIPNTQIFKYPTSLDKSFIQQKDSKPILLERNEKVEVAFFDCDIKDFREICFAKVQLSDESFGYIDTNCFIPLTQNTIRPTVISNARTKEDVVVYMNQSCTIHMTELTQGTEVQIIEEKNGVAKITWGFGDSIGYIYSSHLTEDQISRMQLIGLILMSACILIALVLICISTSRKTKNIEMEEIEKMEEVEEAI